MAVQKRKSLNDIRSQADRLIRRAEDNYNFGRVDRINSIAQRYRDNILKNGKTKAVNPSTFNSVATGGKDTTINPNEKFGRKTYMGNASK